MHIAPEINLQPLLQQLLHGQYYTTDLSMPHISVRMDLTRMCFKSDVFDLIYCSNVLEHIEDDLSAMSELWKALSPGGLAIIQVPIKGETTYENPAIDTPEDRERCFGQDDHVRYYGRDIKLRLAQVGFDVLEVWMPDALHLLSEDLIKYRIEKKELLHFCRK